MARQLVVATKYHHGTVLKDDTWFLAESELDSFSKWVKMSYSGGNMPLRGWRGFKMVKQLVVATIYHHGTVSNADTCFLAESELDSFSK